MPKIDCIKMALDEICMQFCPYVNECPIECECAYIIRIRETIENIRNDNTDNGVEEA